MLAAVQIRPPTIRVQRPDPNRRFFATKTRSVAGYPNDIQDGAQQMTGHRKNGKSHRHRGRKASPRGPDSRQIRLLASPRRLALRSLLNDASTLAKSQTLTVTVTGLSGFTGGYHIQFQDGLTLTFGTDTKFNVDRNGRFRGDAYLSADYHQYLLDMRVGKFTIQLHQNGNSVSGAYATLTMLGEGVTGPTQAPTPVATPSSFDTPSPGPTATLTLTSQVVIVEGPTPEVEDTPTLFPTLPFFVLPTETPLEAVEPEPTAEPTPIPTLEPTQTPTLEPQPTMDRELVVQTLTAQLSVQLTQTPAAPGVVSPAGEADSPVGTVQPDADTESNARPSDDEADDEADTMFGVPTRYLAAVVLLVIGLVGGCRLRPTTRLKLRPQQGGVQANEDVASEDDFADWYNQPDDASLDTGQPPTDGAPDHPGPDPN